MNTTPTFRGFACRDCEEVVGPEDVADRCPACGGPLAGRYDLDAVSAPDSRTGSSKREATAPWYADLLPFGRDAAVSLAEGQTPLVECPSLAEEFGVESLFVKDEGRNPTGSTVDRELSLAATAARERGAGTVALPSTGNGAQSAAAYAARAGLDAEAFVPSRCPFVNKAMTNVHGGEMTVVEGRYDDALAAFENARRDDWADVGPRSPYRVEGAKTVLHEIADQLATVPDAVVTPVGHGIELAGLGLATRERRRLGIEDEPPRLYGAQPSGCAPIVSAWQDGADEPVPEARPDTICGTLEVPKPAAGAPALDAIETTEGGTVAVDDETLLGAAVEAADTTGLEVSATGGTAVAAARELASAGELDEGDTVVVINPVAGSKEDDLLRSYLMGQGV